MESLKKKWILLLSVIIVVLGMTSACQSEAKHDEMEDMIDVKAKISSNPAKVNEPIIFEALVTQGDEKVTDAEMVDFEFYRKDGSDKEKLQVSHQKNGTYRLEKSFSQEGTYYFISHVTARGMHAMPKTEFKITK